MMAARYCKAGARIVLLYYFNVAGPGRDLKYAGAISKMAHSVANGSPPRIFGGGNQIRDFVHVDDVVRANVAAMESNIPYGFFNIGSGAGVSIGNLARLVVKIAGADMEHVRDTPQPGGGGANVASVKKGPPLLELGAEGHAGGMRAKDTCYFFILRSTADMFGKGERDLMRWAAFCMARNEERYITDAVRCILAQTIPPEIFLVHDDGSTDRTGEMLDGMTGVIVSHESSCESGYYTRLYVEKRTDLMHATGSLPWCGLRAQRRCGHADPT